MTATHTGKVNRDQSGGDVKLTGRPLIITRVVWAALSLLVAGLYIWAISSWNLKGQDIPYLVLIPLAYFLAGLVIFWRKSDVLMGLLTTMMATGLLLSQALTATTSRLLDQGPDLVVRRVTPNGGQPISIHAANLARKIPGIPCTRQSRGAVRHSRPLKQGIMTR